MSITPVFSRPEVRPLLVEAAISRHGMYAEFHGDADELIAVGLATRELFDIGSSAQRTTSGEFGDRYTVRRQRGKWTLAVRTQEDMHWPSDSTLDPNGKGYSNKLDRKRWLEAGGAAAEAATAEILARFARPVLPS